LTTQKSVYFNFALGAALVGEALYRWSPVRAVQSGATLMLGWGIIIALYVGFYALGGADPAAILRIIFFGPAVENAVSGHIVYDSPRIFLLHTFFRNALLYAICVAGWLTAVISMRRRTPGERIAMIFTAVIAVLVFRYHSAPWPYNFIMAIPFLALWSPLLIAPIRRLSKPWQMATLAIALLIVGVSFVRNLQYFGHDNAVQERIMVQAESLLEPSEAYFDGIFMIVTRPNAVDRWLGHSAILRIQLAAANGKFNAIENVLANMPKLWILNYRTKKIENILSPFLDDSYVAVASNILLTGMRLEGQVVRVFQNRWPGAYRLYDAEGRPSDATLLLDGVPVNGQITLRTGDYRMRMAAGQEGAYYLLPEGFKAIGPLASDVEHFVLFPWAHNF